MSYGDKVFGLRDVKITNIDGTTQVDLPAAQKLTFKERIKSAELSGDDAIASIVAFVEAVEFDLEAGGISLAAYGLLTGRTVTTTGVTPTETVTLSAAAGDKMPYIKIYGQAMGEGADDIHCKLMKAKVTTLEGGFGNGEFLVTKASGIAIDDGTNGIMEFVQNETAATLPAS